jgi:CubicO group peptidase (beta-lactamase class C family)
MTASATFNAYSVAKTFTATAILLLAERGALALDSPVRDYLDLPVDGRPTLRQTIAHMAGFPNPLPLAWVHPVGAHAGFDRKAFVAATLARHPGLRFPPGQRVAYSNLGYLLLGEVIERISGQTYGDFVASELISRLALTEDAVLSFTLPESPCHAAGHVPRFGLLNLLLGCFVDRGALAGEASGHWQRIRDHYVNGAAFGGLVANAQGLAQWLRALLASDWPTPAVHALLFEPVVSARGPEHGRVLGWFRGELDGHAYYTHAGGGAGYYCEARLYPALGRASVLMLNRSGISDARLLDRVDPMVPAGA